MFVFNICNKKTSLSKHHKQNTEIIIERNRKKARLKKKWKKGYTKRLRKYRVLYYGK